MKMQQGNMGSPPKKSKISRTQVHIVWGGVPPSFYFSAEILKGSNIESAEVHYTKPEDEFCPGIALNTKFRRFFFSRSQVHNLCSGVPLKIPGHRILIFRQQISCPIIERQRKKVRRVCRFFFWQKNLRLQCKVLDPRPIGHGWHMWSGGTCLGNPWKFVLNWWWAM